MKYTFLYLQLRCEILVICVCTVFFLQLLMCFRIHTNHKSCEHAYDICIHANMHATHTHTFIHVCTYISLWCPETVWPSTGMWSEAGNVWAMKACVYAGCSRPPPARGKTDTNTTSFALLPSLLLLQTLNVILSHLCFSKSISSTLFSLFSFLVSFFIKENWVANHNTGLLYRF